jgi:hypothetical protein
VLGAYTAGSLTNELSNYASERQPPDRKGLAIALRLCWRFIFIWERQHKRVAPLGELAIKPIHKYTPAWRIFHMKIAPFLQFTSLFQLITLFKVL